MSERSNELELIDLGPSHFNKEEYIQLLEEMELMGHLSGGDRAGLKAFKRLKKKPQSILDVGCGGGHFAYRLSQLYPEAQVVGIDISPEAIAFAQKKYPDPSGKLSFKHLEHKELNEPPKSFDVVTASLVCHHMEDKEIINFIRRAQNVAKQAIILSDLHRTNLSSLTFHIRAPFHFKSRLIFHDAPISIRRSFKKKDWTHYLVEAGIPEKSYSITWHWIFRWLVVIEI